MRFQAASDSWDGVLDLKASLSRARNARRARSRNRLTRAGMVGILSMGAVSLPASAEAAPPRLPLA
jgi:hypothetical protein